MADLEQYISSIVKDGPEFDELIRRIIEHHADQWGYLEGPMSWFVSDITDPHSIDSLEAGNYRILKEESGNFPTGMFPDDFTSQDAINLNVFSNNDGSKLFIIQMNGEYKSTTSTDTTSPRVWVNVDRLYPDGTTILDFYIGSTTPDSECIWIDTTDPNNPTLRTFDADSNTWPAQVYPDSMSKDTYAASAGVIKDPFEKIDAILRVLSKTCDKFTEHIGNRGMFIHLLPGEKDYLDSKLLTAKDLEDLNPNPVDKFGNPITQTSELYQYVLNAMYQAVEDVLHTDGLNKGINYSSDMLYIHRDNTPLVVEDGTDLVPYNSKTHYRKLIIDDTGKLSVGYDKIWILDPSASSWTERTLSNILGNTTPLPSGIRFQSVIVASAKIEGIYFLDVINLTNHDGNNYPHYLLSSRSIDFSDDNRCYSCNSTTLITNKSPSAYPDYAIVKENFGKLSYDDGNVLRTYAAIGRIDTDGTYNITTAAIHNGNVYSPKNTIISKLVSGYMKCNEFDICVNNIKVHGICNLIYSSNEADGKTYKYLMIIIPTRDADRFNTCLLELPDNSTDVVMIQSGVSATGTAAEMSVVCRMSGTWELPYKKIHFSYDESTKSFLCPVSFDDEDWKYGNLPEFPLDWSGNPADIGCWPRPMYNSNTLFCAPIKMQQVLYSIDGINWNLTEPLHSYFYNYPLSALDIVDPSDGTYIIYNINNNNNLYTKLTFRRHDANLIPYIHDHLTAEEIANWDSSADPNHSHILDGKVNIEGKDVIPTKEHPTVNIDQLVIAKESVFVIDDVTKLGGTEIGSNEDIKGSVLHNGVPIEVRDAYGNSTWYKVIDWTKLGTPDYMTGIKKVSRVVYHPDWDTIIKPEDPSEYGIPDVVKESDMKYTFVPAGLSRAELNKGEYTDILVNIQKTLSPDGGGTEAYPMPSNGDLLVRIEILGGSYGFYYKSYYFVLSTNAANDIIIESGLDPYNSEYQRYGAINDNNYATDEENPLWTTDGLGYTESRYIKSTALLCDRTYVVNGHTYHIEIRNDANKGVLVSLPLDKALKSAVYLYKDSLDAVRPSRNSIMECAKILSDGLGVDYMIASPVRADKYSFEPKAGQDSIPTLRLIAKMQSSVNTHYPTGMFVTVDGDYMVINSKDAMDFMTLADYYLRENPGIKAKAIFANEAIMIILGENGLSYVLAFNNGTYANAQETGLYLNALTLKDCKLLPGWIYSRVQHEDGTFEDEINELKTIQGIDGNGYGFLAFLNDPKNPVIEPVEDEAGTGTGMKGIYAAQGDNLFVAFNDDTFIMNDITVNCPSSYDKDPENVRYIAVSCNNDTTWKFKEFNNSVLTVNKAEDGSITNNPVEIASFSDTSMGAQTARQIVYHYQTKEWFVINETGSAVLHSADGVSWDVWYNPFLQGNVIDGFQTSSLNKYDASIKIIGLVEGATALYAILSDGRAFYYNHDGKYATLSPTNVNISITNAYFIPIEVPEGTTPKTITEISACNDGSLTYIATGSSSFMVLDSNNIPTE